MKDPARATRFLHLVRNPDILFEVGHSNIRPPLVIGFAAGDRHGEILATAVRPRARVVCLVDVVQPSASATSPTTFRCWMRRARREYTGSKDGVGRSRRSDCRFP